MFQLKAGQPWKFYNILIKPAVIIMFLLVIICSQSQAVLG